MHHSIQFNQFCIVSSFLNKTTEDRNGVSHYKHSLFGSTTGEKGATSKQRPADFSRESSWPRTLRRPRASLGIPRSLRNSTDVILQRVSYRPAGSRLIQRRSASVGVAFRIVLFQFSSVAEVSVGHVCHACLIIPPLFT